MNKFLIAIALLTTSVLASADTSIYGSGSVGSDYVVKGQSLNDGEVSYGGMLGIQADNLYAQIGANKTSIDNSTAELLGKVGYKSGEKLKMDVGLSHRKYLGADNSIDATEVNGTVGFDVSVVAVDIGADYNVESGDVYYRAGASFTPFMGISLNAKAGVHDLDFDSIVGGNVSDYSIGASKRFKQGVVVAVDFYDANAKIDPLNIYDKKWVASVGFDF